VNRIALFAFLLSISNLAVASCKAPESLFESKDCLRLELKRIDRDVHTAYLTARKSITQNVDIENTEATLSAFADAQKAWTNYREKECNLELVMNGSSGNAIQNEFACKIELGRKRISHLREIGRE
jgi:uncharacterized protein YecT (DUF1311 family)